MRNPPETYRALGCLNKEQLKKYLYSAKVNHIWLTMSTRSVHWVKHYQDDWIYWYKAILTRVCKASKYAVMIDHMSGRMERLFESRRELKRREKGLRSLTLFYSLLFTARPSSPFLRVKRLWDLSLWVIHHFLRSSSGRLQDEFRGGKCLWQAETAIQRSEIKCCKDKLPPFREPTLESSAAMIWC